MALHGTKDAAARAVAGLQREDQGAVLTATSDTEVEQAVTSNVEKQFAEVRDRYFQQPRRGVPEKDQSTSTWGATVGQEVSRRQAGNPPSDAEAVCPQLVKAVDACASRAREKIKASEERLAQLDEKISEAVQDEIEHFRHHARPGPLRAKRRLWRWILASTFLLEAIFNIALWGSWSGAFSAHSLSRIKWDRVAQAVTYGVATVGISFGAANALGRW